jgi:hypothetical protein
MTVEGKEFASGGPIDGRTTVVQEYRAITEEKRTLVIMDYVKQKLEPDSKYHGYLLQFVACKVFTDTATDPLHTHLRLRSCLQELVMGVMESLDHPTGSR